MAIDKEKTHFKVEHPSGITSTFLDYGSILEGPRKYRIVTEFTDESFILNEDPRGFLADRFCEIAAGILNVSPREIKSTVYEMARLGISQGDK